MPDLSLRLNQDCLSIGTDYHYTLDSYNLSHPVESEWLNLLEPETVERLYAQELLICPAALCALSAYTTKNWLNHLRLGDRQEDVVRQSLRLARQQKPQQLLFELAPCDLPLDPASAHSLKAYRDQYSEVVRAAQDESVDAVFLSGFLSCSELKAALMGVRSIADEIVFGSLVFDQKTTMNRSALGELLELGLDVLGLRINLSSNEELWALSHAAYARRIGVDPLEDKQLRTLEAQGISHEQVAYASRCVEELVAIKEHYATVPLLLEFQLIPQQSKNRGAYGKAHDRSGISDILLSQCVSELRQLGVSLLRGVGAWRPAYNAVLVCEFQDKKALI